MTYLQPNPIFNFSPTKPWTKIVFLLHSSYRAVLSVESSGREVVWRGGGADGAPASGGHGGRLAELGVALLERRSSLAR